MNLGSCDLYLWSLQETFLVDPKDPRMTQNDRKNGKNSYFLCFNASFVNLSIDFVD